MPWAGSKGASLWRGRPLPLPSASGNCWWKGNLSVPLCSEVVENWFKNEMQCRDASWVSLRISNIAASVFACVVLKVGGGFSNKLTRTSTGCFAWAPRLIIYISTNIFCLKLGLLTSFVCVCQCVCLCVWTISRLNPMLVTCSVLRLTSLSLPL